MVEFLHKCIYVIRSSVLEYLSNRMHSLCVYKFLFVYCTHCFMCMYICNLSIKSWLCVQYVCLYQTISYIAKSVEFCIARIYNIFTMK